MFPYERLVTATSGIADASFIVDGVTYVRSYKLDSRFPGMDPMVCFSPNLVSATPSVSPTQAPTMVHITVVKATQVRKTNTIVLCFDSR